MKKETFLGGSKGNLQIENRGSYGRESAKLSFNCLKMKIGHFWAILADNKNSSMDSLRLNSKDCVLSDSL